MLQRNRSSALKLSSEKQSATIGMDALSLNCFKSSYSKLLVCQRRSIVTGERDSIGIGRRVLKK